MVSFQKHDSENCMVKQKDWLIIEGIEGGQRDCCHAFGDKKKDASMSAGLVCVADFKLSGSRLNVKTVFPRYGDSHVKDKTVARPSYL